MAYCTSMGFSIGYSQILLLILLIPIHNLLLRLRKAISTLFLHLGLPDFFQTRIPCRDTTEAGVSASSSPATRHLDILLWVLLCWEYLPVVKFCDLVDPLESCAVCFCEFEREDEIRQLTNCRHVFHRSCLDRWMGNNKKTCPLCRTSFIPYEMQDRFNESLWYWAATGMPCP